MSRHHLKVSLIPLTNTSLNNIVSFKNALEEEERLFGKINVHYA